MIIRTTKRRRQRASHQTKEREGRDTKDRADKQKQNPPKEVHANRVVQCGFPIVLVGVPIVHSPSPCGSNPSRHPGPEDLSDRVVPEGTTRPLVTREVFQKYITLELMSEWLLGRAKGLVVKGRQKWGEVKRM